METPNLKNLPEVKKKAVLLTLQELFSESLEVAVKSEQLNVILNTAPPEKWVKVHPHIPGWKYIPIDKVEYLLLKLFKRYSVEVRKTGMLMNAVEVTVRVSYFDPVLGQTVFNDGVGACELQTQAKSGALKMDMSNVNRGAVSMALPIAKSLAIKDATDHIGKIFGRDLNRKDVLNFEPDMALIDRYNSILEQEPNGN